MSNVGHRFADEWIVTMKDKKYDKLRDFFRTSSQVYFHSPVVHTRYEGIEAIELILRNVIEVFHNFRYINDGYVTSGPIPASKRQTPGTESVYGVVLLFAAQVEDPDTHKILNVEGVDIFEVDENGKAVYLKVMVRPLNAAIALAKTMKARISGKM